MVLSDDDRARDHARGVGHGRALGQPDGGRARRTQPGLASLAAGVIIGAAETVLALSFAALVFGGLLVGHLADGIGLYLGAAAITLAVLAWRAGSRGVVGGVQEAAAAVLAGVATTSALNPFGGPGRALL